MTDSHLGSNLPPESELLSQLLGEVFSLVDDTVESITDDYVEDKLAELTAAFGVGDRRTLGELHERHVAWRRRSTLTQFYRQTAVSCAAQASVLDTTPPGTTGYVHEFKAGTEATGRESDAAAGVDAYLDRVLDQASDILSEARDRAAKIIADAEERAAQTRVEQASARTQRRSIHRVSEALTCESRRR